MGWPRRDDREPLQIGPDATGVTAVFTGDRLSWIGTGSPPVFPGARRIPAGRGLIARPSVYVAALTANRQPAEPGLDATTAVLILREGDSHRASTETRRLARSGRRVILLMEVPGEPDPLAVAEVRTEALLHSFVRFGFLHAGAGPPVAGQDIPARDFGVLTVLSEELAPSAAGYALVRKMFGRPAALLTESALGDAIIRDSSTGAVQSAIAAGRIVPLEGYRM